MVKSLSSYGRIMVRSWSSHRQIMVKPWSDHGQIMVKSWSDHGQFWPWSDHGFHFTNMVDHGLTMVSWWSDHGQSWSVTMVDHGQMTVDHGLTANMSQGNVTAGDTDHGYWPWSDHVNMVMPQHCFYPVNSNILTKKCLKMSVGDISYGTFCFSLIKKFVVVLDCWPWLTTLTW